jgi:hypothetical protein
MLRQRLTESMDNPRHFEKVKWFASYWNESIPAGAKEVERITGFGLDPRPAVFE